MWFLTKEIEVINLIIKETKHLYIKKNVYIREIGKAK